MKSFVFYLSFYEAMEDMTDEQELTLYRAISKYALFGEEPSLTGVVKLAFTLIKPQLEANRKKRIDGKKGGRPSKEKDDSCGFESEKPVVLEDENHSLKNKKPNENVNVNVNGNVNSNANINENNIPPIPQGERKSKRTPLEIPTQSETGFSNAMQEAFETWLQYKKEKKQTYQPTGLKTFIRKLKSCVEQYGENAVIDMLERAISSGYAGPVWESLKNSANPPKKETPKKKEGAWDGFWHPGMEELFPPVNGAPRN